MSKTLAPPDSSFKSEARKEPEFPAYGMVAQAYVLILLLSPLAALLWSWNWGWLKANWILYPLMIVALLLSLRTSRREPRRFLLGLVSAVSYFFYFLFQGGDVENVLRMIVAVLPLLLITPIRQHISPELFNRFWKWYLIILLVPLTLTVLQIFHVLPFNDPETVYGWFPGRISGGYQKPNNLNAFLFPAWLYGFHLFFQGKKRSGILLSSLIFVVVLISGLRTSVLAYAIILLLAFIPGHGNKILQRGFQYGIFLLIAVGSFFALSQVRENFGLVEGLRRRIPMWTIHAEYFFKSTTSEIFFGKGKVDLPEGAKQFALYTRSEVHNNDFRMMITFGLVGYFLYALLLRQTAAAISHSDISARMRFLQLACLVHVLIYSITNEPAFYPAILWPMTLWLVFPQDGKPNQA